MTLVEAALLGVVQGLTEFLPVSSSAHLILARAVLGWDAGNLNLPFDVACHLGTLAAVVTYFRVDILDLVRGVPAAFSTTPGPSGRRLWLLVAATLPIVMAGLFFRSSVEFAREQTAWTAWALILGAGLLFLVERLRGRVGTDASLSAVGAFGIGVAQAVALIPGVSRSGATITAGMLTGMSRVAAARFAFLMAVPAIGAAAAAEAVALRGMALTPQDWQLFATGLVTSGAVGYLAVSVLLKFLVSHRLDVFAWYRIAVGLAILWWL